MNELPHNDHRRLGQNLDLFHIERGAPGFIYWHPKGWELYQKIEQFIREKMKAYEYQEVKSPMILPQKHWEASGHWEKFGDNMFKIPMKGEDALALKPMSCPGHVAIFNSKPRSWRDLPQKYCEFGQCHRLEPSGALLGLMRARAFEQDDAHVLCLEEQVQDEISNFVSLLKDVYGAFGFDNIDVALSLRPEKRAGSDADWDWSESVLLEAAQKNNLDPRLLPGEGAFYGPKLEFALKDNSGRKWQCGTIQLDRVLPQRLGAQYKGSDGEWHIPFMLHHAVLGSLSRFIGIMLEHYEGHLPLWLSPEPIAIFPIGSEQEDAAWAFAQQLKENNIPSHVVPAEQSLAKRMVLAKSQHIPIFIIIGEREEQKNSVAIKQGRDQSVYECKDAVKHLISLLHKP